MNRLGASALLCATVFGAACGGGDGGTTPAQHYTLGVSLDRTSVTIAAGGTATLTVTIARGGGLPGDVTLGMEGVPSGVGITFSPPALSGTANTSSMTIAVDRMVAVGRYLMTVRGLSPQIDEVGAQVWLDVTAPPDYSLETAHDTLTIIQGTSGQLDVELTRVSGFTGQVTLSLGGLPGGATGTFAPNPVTVERSTLTLSVGASVPPGTSTITVNGAAEGLPGRTTTFVLQVLSNDTPGFTLSVSRPTLTVVAGSSAADTVILHRTGGFTGGVSLAAQGQPAGVAVDYGQNPVTGTLAVVTFTASPALQASTATVTLLATAAGFPDRQATVQLTVQEQPGFWIALSSNTISTAPGAAPQTLTVQITRTGGFSDSVHLAMADLPTGITATFNPAATLANATVTIAVASTVGAGTYTGTLHASAAGLAERTTTLTIAVAASAADIVWRFCSPKPTPVFVAVQDGASPYAAVSPQNDGSYVTSLAAGKGAVVMVVPGLPDTTGSAAVPGRVAAMPPHTASPAATGYTTYMYYGTVADLQALAATQCPAAGAPRTIHGSVASVPAGRAWTVALDGASATGMPGAGSSFTLSGALAGARDLVAARAPVEEHQTLADAMIIRRGVDAADGSTLPVIDFGAAEAFAPATGALVVSGMPVGTATAEVVLGFSTANGTSALIGQLDSVTSTTRLISVVPTARLLAGDLQTATATAEANGTELTATLYAAQVGNWALAFGTPPQAPNVDVYATAPTVRLRARGSWGTLGGAYGAMVRAAFVQAGAQRATVIYQTRNYVGTSGSFELRTGGYNTLSGWNESLYGFQQGAITTWDAELLSTGYVAAPADGTVLQTMTTSGHVTP